MNNTLIELKVATIPAPQLAITAWLLAPFQNIGQEGNSELRQTLIRRLGAVLISALMMSGTSILVSLLHSSPIILIWTALDLGLSTLRLPIIFYMLHVSRGRGKRDLSPKLIDFFIVVGTLWSSVVGFGMLACILTSDPGLSMLASALALGTIGAQGVRSPGSPRLNIVQMCLVILPYMAGLLSSTIPLALWIALLTPFYLFGMIGITLQLHSDYVKLIISRIENRLRALHCPLTGLPNRAFFQERLETEHEKAEGGAASVLYLDLDGFKIVNDTLGHGAGDELLRQVADRLLAWEQPDTFVARLGGDEFAIITHGVSEQIEAAVDKLIDRIGEGYNLGVYGTASVSVSVGIATAEPGSDSRTIMLQADQALYAAKGCGKGTYRWHGDNAPEYVRSHSSDLRNIAARMENASLSSRRGEVKLGEINES